MPIRSLLILSVTASAAIAGVRTDVSYGHQFVHVGHANNRAANDAERVNGEFARLDRPDLGRVNRRYRIMTTQVSNTDWLAFMNAYHPYFEADGGSRLDSRFTGIDISPTTLAPGQNPGYYIYEGHEHRPVKISGRMAMRYANWLHSGKGTQREAFENGAYDTSTFQISPDFWYFDQAERSAGAQFWIPSLNEWIKAAHFDPDRYGEGEAGYWKYPTLQDTAPIAGPPGEGQTNRGGGFPGGGDAAIQIPLGSYPEYASAWGMLDASGGSAEWTETVPAVFDLPIGDVHLGQRVVTSSGSSDHWWEDGIDWYNLDSVNGGLVGFRVASVVPAPPSIGVALVAVGLLTRRRR